MGNIYLTREEVETIETALYHAEKTIRDDPEARKAQHSEWRAWELYKIQRAKAKMRKAKGQSE